MKLPFKAGVVLLAVIAAPALFVGVFGWNWLRSPIERMAMEKTGRALLIGGDLRLQFGWPWSRIRMHAEAVTFANPGWAKEKQMFAADAVDIAIDLPQLLRRKIVVPELRLVRPIVFLEHGVGGRKNWLLDIDQQDEGARIQIDRLTLDQGSLGYDDAAQQTSLRARLSTTTAHVAGAEVGFVAQGRYKGLPFKASGNGGSVLGLRDENTPYPVNVEISVGRTHVKADGAITGLLKLSAMDMRLAIRGDSLAQLYPLLGIVFPETRAYATAGRIVHSAHLWSYENFSGRIGGSDIAGAVRIDTRGKRPAMKADLVSKLLDIADLGPLIGAKPGRLKAAAASARVRVLPDMPFNTKRWGSVDAEVTLKAGAIRHAKALPLDNLYTHLSLRNSVLTLDPLNFGVAGGQLGAVITLDGGKDPIHAHAHLQARKILIAKLFPTVELNKVSLGQLNGEFDLAGNGNSVRQMLASANGRVGLVVVGGKISKLMMEQVGLHLWEILVLKLSGDRPIALRCGVADFHVEGGAMRVDALIFDTEVTTIVGAGTINLKQEQLNLTLNQKTKDTSFVALSSPIYVRGSFAQPSVEVDKGRVVVRALGAIALSMLNPMLTLLPLIDAGPGKDSDCRQLVREAKKITHSKRKKNAVQPATLPRPAL